MVTGGGSCPVGKGPDFTLAFSYTSTSQYTFTAWRFIKKGAAVPLPFTLTKLKTNEEML
jgi:hypothetical protein